MNANRVWGSVVAVLALVCMGLACWLREHRTGPEQLQRVPAASGEPAQREMPVLSPENFPARTSTAYRPPGAQQTGATRPERQALERWPSWLVIPEEKKIELARLTAELAFPGFSGPAATDPEARKRAELNRQAMDERRGLTELRIQQLLGMQTYSLWKEYHDSATARGVLASLNDRLGPAGLSEETVRAAAASMTAGEQRAHLEREALYGERNRVMTTQEDIDAERESHIRLMDLMRASLSPHLTLVQLQAYDQMQQDARRAFDAWLQRQQAMVTAYQALARETADKRADQVP